MTSAIEIRQLNKSFRVARPAQGGGADSADPRRERLSRRHDRFHALRDISFTVEAGRTVGVVGANGSGKSTLLKLGGVMQPDSGAFRLSGRVGALLEIGAGFHPDLSGIDNVYLNGALLGIPSRQITHLLPEIIRFAELERFMDLPVKHFSSGMTARLGFALAAQLAPDILLMDETFATGDARFQSRALQRISEMKGQGRTMLLVSHNLDMMLQLADEVLWLDQGRLRAHGETREVLMQYREQHHARLFGADQTLARLGLEGLFQPYRPEQALVRIIGVELQSPGESEWRSDSIVTPGATLRLRLRLKHPERHPAGVGLELAWQRLRDGLVLGQTRQNLRLEEGASTDVVLAFNDWLLDEGDWNLAVGVRLAEAETPHGGGGVFVDRRLEAGRVHVDVDVPLELPGTARIPARWELSTAAMDSGSG